MKTYPGLPAPEVDLVMDYEASHQHYRGEAEFQIASLHLCGNTGTYVDSPRHRFRDGADLASIPLESVAHLPVTLVGAQAQAGRGIGPECFTGAEISGRAVLINTGWSKHWRSEAYFTGHPYLTRPAAELLAASGARLVGIDSLNIDDTGDFSRPAHSILLGAGIPVCEHMTNLGSLPPRAGFLHAVPIAWMGGTSFPVRAYVVYLNAAR